MEIGKKMEKSINSQIQAEFQSSYLYLSMAAWCDNQDMPGCANWLKKQAAEEWGHGMKLYSYLVSRFGRVVLAAIETPKNDWKNVLEVFAEVKEHEEMVTKRFYVMSELAESENDIATVNALAWFIDEQVEEEEHAAAILNKFKKLGDSPVSLYMLDKELGARA